MSREMRIHHRQRIKASRRYYWGRDLSHEPKQYGMAVDTPKPCSCWMCGNPRGHKGPTMQERRAAHRAMERE